MKIQEIVIEPDKIYINSLFNLKIKVEGVKKAYRYKDYNSEKFTDYNEEKYSSIRKWDEI